MAKVTSEAPDLLVAYQRKDLEQYRKKYESSPIKWTKGETQMALTLANRLIVELTQACRDELTLDATDVESILDTDEGAAITWVSSTWIEPELVNLFICSVGQKPISVVATHHGDRGVLMGVSGAFESVLVAKECLGQVPEGWTDIK